MKITHRITGAVLFEDDSATIKETLEAAVKAGANLAGANLADLADTDLAGANLAGANLAGAYLADAYLADADLAGANLAGAYLAGAYLAGAYLADTDLAGANLAGANLADADLADADLAGANLAGAINVPASGSTESIPAWTPMPKDPGERVKRYRLRHPDVPVVEDLDRKILSAIESGGSLEMARWHTCETTHCLAGWAVYLAGAAGKALEEKYGPQRAGTLIYNVSTGRAPHFFASNERALADLRERAGKSSV